MPDPSKPPKKPLNPYIKYSSMVFQMGAIIGLGTYLGTLLDDYWELEKPLATLVLSLLSVFAALYIVLKDFIRKS